MLPALAPLLLAAAVPASAHPPADALAADALAAEGGCDPAALLARGRALGAEGRAEEALAALAQARACGADPGGLALARGLALAGPGLPSGHPSRPEAALHELDAALIAAPDHAGARAARARVLAALGRPAEAADDLRALRDPGPDDRLLLARLLAGLGHREAALAVLDAGAPGAALVEEAVALELAAGRPEAALGRLEAMPATPYWLARRAEVATLLEDRP